MPNYDAVINDVVLGNDIDVIRTVSPIPATQTVSEAWLRVMNPNGNSQLYQKHITPVLVPGEGQIEDIGAGGVAICRFEMSATDTATLTGGESHPYGIQIKTSAGKIYEFEIGTIPAISQIVLAA